MKHSLFIGRWQPFHEGHKALIETVLSGNKPVVIGIRDTPLSPQNPYSMAERWAMINEALKDYARLVRIIAIPDIDEICYGRQVGYAIRRIDLAEGAEAISATKKRREAPKIVWLTGNSGSGKTTLAYALKERMDAVILDGDEMRASISLGAGFSKEEREIHNLRVARLAGILHKQRHNVIIAVIAPFRSTRAKIDRLIRPIWIYVKRDLPIAVEKPYEVPKSPALEVDTDTFGIVECANQIWQRLQELGNDSY